MERTANLDLPYIMPSQAQKHVTHNEAIRIIDGLVQLAVLGRDRTEPPPSPADGERHIVAAGATGSWEGWDDAIAYFVDGAWMRLEPRAGWTAWMAEEARAAVWDGSRWAAVETGISPQQAGDGTLSRLGVNTGADAVNRLAVKADAILFAHDDVTPGTGDIRLALNKAAAGNTASLLFQDAWSAQAELGLAGDDDFRIKVSADGAQFHTAIEIARDGGTVRFPRGTGGTGSPAGCLGAQVMAFCCERTSSFNVNMFMAHGNGATQAAGPAMPFAGRVIAATMAFASGGAGNNRLEMAVNKVPDATHALVINYSGSGVQSVSADWSADPLAFAAGDALNFRVAQTSSTANVVTATFFVVFD
jgi:hypothetical protein